MNVQLKMKYLDGGDAVFGPNFGEAKVYTVTPTNYAERCPNVAKFLDNLSFTTDIENQVMLAILEKQKPEQAGRAWLRKNPQVLDGWLKDVKTVDGKDGLPVVTKALAGG